MQKLAAIYARVSTNDQSVEMQLRDLRRYAIQRGFQIGPEFTDSGYSGSKDSRPALQSLMKAARQREFDVVLVWRFDRWARSTKHLVESLLEFQSLKIDFVSYQEALDTSSPMGQAMFTIIAALGQLERDIIIQRVKAGLANAKAKGTLLGRPKLRDDISIMNLRQSGNSIRSIASKLGIAKSTVQTALAVRKTR